MLRVLMSGVQTAYLDEVEVRRGEMSEPAGVIAPFDFYIAPEMVVIPSQGLLSSFGSAEREDVAEAIVRLAQQKRGWPAFTRAEVERVWRSTPPAKAADDYLAFYSLQRTGHIVETRPGQFQVTSEFVEQCFESAKKYADH